MPVTILEGDCREVLKNMDDNSVQMVCTSPPYYGLRDYQTGTWEGGDAGCDHGVRRWDGPKQTQGAQSGHASAADNLARSQCACGARRVDRQIGLEQSPAEYVAQLVEVFREVRRVLRSDGTLWLNLGDSYAGNGVSGLNVGWADRAAEQYRGGGNKAEPSRVRTKKTVPTGLKPKDLMMMPARVAIALQDAGWWIRSDIIWSKPNPMPESVIDRPTKSHEYVFLLTKAERYFYDAKAIAEPATYGQPNSPQSIKSPHGQGFTRRAPVIEEGRKDLATATYERHRSSIAGGQSLQAEPTETRNARSVWAIATTPSPLAHFAMMPVALAERCIKAGSRPGDTVLDPFAGAGTTLLVADRLQRSAVGIELNPANCTMLRKRLAADAPLLTEVA